MSREEVEGFDASFVAEGSLAPEKDSYEVYWVVFFVDVLFGCVGEDLSDFQKALAYKNI